VKRESGSLKAYRIHLSASPAILKLCRWPFNPKTCCGQKPIGVLNSARMGERAKPKQISKFFPQKLVRSGKSSKYEENDYKSSLGCLRQKQIGALN
jgi:hypothetical protein